MTVPNNHRNGTLRDDGSACSACSEAVQVPSLLMAIADGGHVPMTKGATDGWSVTDVVVVDVVF